MRVASRRNEHLAREWWFGKGHKLGTSKVLNVTTTDKEKEPQCLSDMLTFYLILAREMNGEKEEGSK